MTAKTEKLPNRIRELRQAKGWTLEELAFRAGCSTPTIHDLERGKLRLSDKWMRQIAPIFGLSPADLLSDEDFPERLRGRARKLNDIFYGASPDQQEQILRVAEALAGYRAESGEAA